MKLQYLPRVSAKTAIPLTQESFDALVNDAKTAFNVEIARKRLAEGNKESYAKAKALLPAVMWVGYDAEGKGRRKADELTPTQLYMVDIDHMTTVPREAWVEIRERVMRMTIDPDIVVAHVTPSGRGLRIVARAVMPFETLKEHMDWLVDSLRLQEFGDYDAVCKDFSRLSFLVPLEDFLVLDPTIFTGEPDKLIIKKAYDNGNDYGTDAGQNKPADGQRSDSIEKHDEEDGVNRVSSSESERPGGESGAVGAECGTAVEEATYHGHPYGEIVKRYLSVFGEPEVGERHTYYNRMIIHFRSICNNDPYLLHSILPNFVKDSNETLAQCIALCKSNKTVTIPRPFYFFLKDNGYLNKNEDVEEEEEGEDVEAKKTEKVPELPPVFREFCSICPPDFVKPTIAALLPILGTLTSYVRGEYNGKPISTTFFSCIYAPPSSGKSFVDLPQNILFAEMKKRDLLNQLRENIYRQLCARKKDGTNPEDPHVLKRFLATKYTEADFFPKMVDLKGYHMYLFAAEIDQLIKGMKYGSNGADKSDLLRIGWDNGAYSQQNRSPNSWSGVVNIYLNILMTGTLNQVFRCFKDVEDGMITRMTFCALQNQEFADLPTWKKLTKKQTELLEAFVKKCDTNTYEEPLEFSDYDDAYRIGEAEEFDEQVPWKYKFKDFKQVSTKWLMPSTNRWLKKWQQIALRDRDLAKDTFRRRRGEIAHRMALICSQLWPTFGKKEQKITRDFILWWLDVEMEEAYKLFGEKYNEVMNEKNPSQKKGSYATAFDMLPEEFDLADIESVKRKSGNLSRAKQMVSDWRKAGLCVKVGKNKWKKK